MARAIIKFEGKPILSVPRFGAEPYLGRNLYDSVSRDRSISAVLKAAEPYGVDILNRHYAEQAKRVEEAVLAEAQELERKAAETRVPEAKESLKRRAGIMRRFSILKKAELVGEREFKGEAFFEYDVRRNFGLIYVVTRSQAGKSKPQKLEKALAELDKRDININV